MFISIIAYFFIPAYTIFFVEGSDWFTTNFSVIGNLAGRQGEFVLWGLCVGIYFFWCLRKIVSCMEKRPKGMWLIPLSLVLLTFAITTPYLPEALPFKSFLHIVFAFMAAVCLMFRLYPNLIALCRQEKNARLQEATASPTYCPYLTALNLITLISGTLLWLVGIVSSALEIFFTISTVILVKKLYERTQQDIP